MGRRTFQEEGKDTGKGTGGRLFAMAEAQQGASMAAVGGGEVWEATGQTIGFGHQRAHLAFKSQVELRVG